MPDMTATSRHYGDELSLRLADIRRLEPLEDPAQFSAPLRRLVDAIGHLTVLERHKVRRGDDWPGDIERAQARWRAHRDGRIESAGPA